MTDSKSSTPRLNKLENRIGYIRTDQAVIKNDVSSINNTLSNLVDLRAESLYLIKKQEENRKEHDEIFNRLRLVESTQSTCTNDRANIKKVVNRLENNQRSGVIAGVLLLLSIIGYFIKGIFGK